ncbi:MAG: Hsp20/alpha crystallin family protein [Gaiellaceae bacterium]
MVGNVSRVTGFLPTLDVRETDDEYLVLVDLPGVKPEDVAIELNDEVLTISGSRAPVETGQARRSERLFGSFVRRLTLPKGVDSEERRGGVQGGRTRAAHPEAGGREAEEDRHRRYVPGGDRAVAGRGPRQTRPPKLEPSDDSTASRG